MDHSRDLPNRDLRLAIGQEYTRDYCGLDICDDVVSKKIMPPETKVE